MKTINPTFLFCSLLLLSLLCSCGTGNNNTDALPKGQLYFYAQYEPHNRMLVADGTHTLLGLALEIEQIEKDSIKTAIGKQLYISFKKPEQLVKGAHFDFPNPDIDIVISNWEAATKFDLNRNITGSIDILDYDPLHKVSFSLDLKMRTGLDKFQRFQRKNVEIECEMLHKAYGAPAYQLEEYDSSYVVEDLTPQSLDGQWKRVREIFYMPQNNTYREYFYFHEPLTWDIQNGEFVVHEKRTPIRIEGRRLIFTEMISGNKMFFAINSFDGKKLTITNLNDISKTRYVFEKY